MTKPATFRDLIDGTFGGREPFATETGIDIGHVDVMKHRGSIAADHWPAIIEASDRLGLGITFSDLAALRAAFKARPRIAADAVSSPSSLEVSGASA